MKKYIIGILIIAVVVVSLILVGQGNNEKISDNGKINAAASIFPLYDLVKIVGGENVNAKLVISPGASPHTLDITPDIAKTIEEADIIFVIGHNLDEFLFRGKEKLVVVDKGISIRENEEEHEEEEEEHEGEEHGPTDPHYWLNPGNAGLIAGTIAENLSKLDPDNAGAYEARAEEYRNLLEEKTREWKENLNVEGAKLVTFHDAFYYFADFFGINVVGTVEIAPGREPTARELARLREVIEKHNITTLFLEPQLAGSVISQFAKDNGIKLDTLDPLGGVEGRNSYIELIEYNLQRIKMSS